MMHYLYNIFQDGFHLFQENTLTVVFEIILIVIYLLVYSKLSRLAQRVKSASSRYFTMDALKKDYRIKKACIETTAVLKCTNTMVFRLHNGESAGDHYHFQRLSAIFDEPRDGAKLLMPEWQNISYGIFAKRLDQLFEKNALHSHIYAISPDNSYQAFHLQKGIYYEILLPVEIKDKVKHPFGYLAAFFNEEQAIFFKENPEAITTYLEQLRKLKANIEVILEMKVNNSPRFPRIFGFGG